MLPVCLAHTASLAPWLPGLGPCKGKLRSACIYLTQIKGRGRGLQLEFHSEVHFLGEFQAESRSVTNTFDAVKRLVLVWKKPCIFSGKSEALSIFLGWGVGGVSQMQRRKSTWERLHRFHPALGSPPSFKRHPEKQKLSSCHSFHKYSPGARYVVAIVLSPRDRRRTKPTKSLPTGAHFLVPFSPQEYSAQLSRPTLESTSVVHTACPSSSTPPAFLDSLSCETLDFEEA